MKTIAIMPIKLNNERCPGKNTRFLGNKPLLQYELDTLKKTRMLDEIFVYCSSDQIREYLPQNVILELRPKELDSASTNFTQIFSRFMEGHDADIYVYAHATAPFISLETMKECILAVKNGGYDSAFCAEELQDYLWQDNEPLNFDAENLPRTQDLKKIYRETSGIYVFTKDVFEKKRRRVGDKPYIKKVSSKEAIDIDEPEDFRLAELMLNVNL